MKKKNVFFYSALALGMMGSLASCSSDDELVSGNIASEEEIANAQTLSVQVENAGDNYETRAGRPLYSSEAKQAINTVKVVIYKLTPTLGTDDLAGYSTLDAALANPTAAAVIEKAMYGADKEVVAVKTFENWMTEHVSDPYSDNGHGRMASWSLPKTEWIKEDNANAIYAAYAVGYDSDDYSSSASLNAFKGVQAEATVTLPVTVDANKTADVDEIFAGATVFTVTKTNLSAGDDEDYVYRFNSTLTLHRQVAGSYGYFTDIPVHGNNETDASQTKTAAKLRLVAASANKTAIFGAFNSAFLGANDGTANTDPDATGVKYIMNGMTSTTADVKFYGEVGVATNNAYLVYEANLADWFTGESGMDTNGDGVLNAKDKWTQPTAIPTTSAKFKTGSVFAGNFMMPFIKQNVATFQLQTLDADGNILRWWNIRIPSADVIAANTLGVWSVDATTGVLGSAKYATAETADSYSIVRNHLYTIGVKDKDIPGDPEIEDDPQSLGQETIILRVNDNWEMIHKLEVD